MTSSCAVVPIFPKMIHGPIEELSDISGEKTNNLNRLITYKLVRLAELITFRT